jgi:hypothetical protein
MKNINDIIVTAETFKLAKEKGYVHNELSVYRMPSQSYLQSYLRNVHGIFIDLFTMGIYMNKLTSPHTEFKVSKGFEKYNYAINSDTVHCRGFKTYEEALEAGLQQSFKIIKLNK